jgi:hypothetical protein
MNSLFEKTALTDDEIIKFVNKFGGSKKVQDFLQKESIEPPLTNLILKQLSDLDKLVIGTTTGKRTLAKAKNTFCSGIDSDFKNLGTDQAGIAKAETKVSVYELVSHARFAEMFNSLSTDLDKLCLTQDQIIEFCTNQSSWLRQDGYGTFFLFKVKDEFFVCGVYVDDDGLYANVYRLAFGYVWGAVYAHRVVVPQLNP